jgi:hypothetical protein
MEAVLASPAPEGAPLEGAKERIQKATVRRGTHIAPTARRTSQIAKPSAHSQLPESKG